MKVRRVSVVQDNNASTSGRNDAVVDLPSGGHKGLAQRRLIKWSEVIGEESEPVGGDGWLCNGRCEEEAKRGKDWLIEGKRRAGGGLDKWEVLPNGWALLGGFSSHTTDDWTEDEEDGGGENDDWRNWLIFHLRRHTPKYAREAVP